MQLTEAHLNDEIAKRMARVVEFVAGKAKARVIGKRASNPPYLLGVVSGRLRQSIGAKVTRTPEGVQGKVGTRVVYAAIHEFGGKTKQGGVIPARPYLGPALAESRQMIVEELGDAYVATLRRAKTEAGVA
jgi:phage gpG-like protein